eukprot:CAMPEP_0182499968 /NCGR_PEP_ID=MMETSP1321-20130603/8049_1 /TAXON_ID=91990 /ORGANISM="Bolidomonas sp., Strain RCC1657" /LENGTH=301 /DNA_ID=CAMNT_0024704225 /DNA_START=133 /DNA_END=1036 /DNA_ORIENTATION=-
MNASSLKTVLEYCCTSNYDLDIEGYILRGMDMSVFNEDCYRFLIILGQVPPIKTSEGFEEIWGRREERYFRFFKDERSLRYAKKNIEREYSRWVKYWDHLFIEEGVGGELSRGEWEVDDFYVRFEIDDFIEEDSMKGFEDGEEKEVKVIGGEKTNKAISGIYVFVNSNIQKLLSSSDGKKVSVMLSELRRLNVWYRNYLFSNSEVISVGVSGEIVDAIVGWLRTGRLNSYREIRRILEAGLLYDFRELCNQIFEMLYEDMDKIEDRVLVDILMIEEDIFRVKARVGREIVKRKIEVDEEVW